VEDIEAVQEFFLARGALLLQVAWLMAEGCSKYEKEEEEEREQYDIAWKRLLLLTHEKLYPPITWTAGEFQGSGFTGEYL
jgi:hypothetical protein